MKNDRLALAVSCVAGSIVGVAKLVHGEVGLELRRRHLTSSQRQPKEIGTLRRHEPCPCYDLTYYCSSCRL